MAPAALDLLTGWSLFASLALAEGSVALRWVVLPGDPAAPSSTSVDGRRAAARLGMRSGELLLAALVLALARQLVEFHDPLARWTDDARLLLGGTDWGATWLAATGAALLARAGFAMAASDVRAGWPVATAAVLALGAFPALTGHANAGDWRAATLVADTLHVWAMGAWIGTLSAILALERRSRRTPGAAGGKTLLPVLVPRFSPLAVGAVATLLVTGVFSAWVHLGGLDPLLGTRYGRLLLIKVAAALLALGIGALNWRVLRPLLAGPEGPRSMRRAAMLELLVANVVLLVTALLVRTSPR